MQQAAAQALTAVTRARALFPDPPEPPPADTLLPSAAQSTADTGQHTSALTGVLADRHTGFADDQAERLSDAGRTDTALTAHLNTAAAVSRSGARQLDTIVEQTRALARTAPYARTPAEQRVVLAGLQSRVSAADAVVTNAGQQATAVASGIRALGYGTGGIKPAGFGPGGAPQDPPPPPPTPADPDDAARRRDQAIVDDPHADPAARRLAQERLDDLKNSKFIGPLTADPVMGGDARTRAQGQREFQQMLESGMIAGQPAMTPDQATALIDQLEARGRQMVLGNFADQLKAAGVSPPGIQRALDEVQSGKTPWEIFHDTGSGLSTWGGSLGSGAEQHGAALPHGRHWGDAPVWSEGDAMALEAFGKRLGAAGLGLDALITLGDISHGQPAPPAIAEFGGRTLGGMLGAAGAGAAWGSLVGPEGTLIVGLLGAIGGAIGGEKFVKWALGE